MSTCNQRFQVIEFVEPTHFRKALNLIFSELSSQNMRGFHHATILSPSFHGLRKERLARFSSVQGRLISRRTDKLSCTLKWPIGHACPFSPYFSILLCCQSSLHCRFIWVNKWLKISLSFEDKPRSRQPTVLTNYARNV